MERIIDIQMNREERLFTYGIEFVVELLVLLGGDLGGFYGPQRGDVVDDVVLVGIDVFAVFPLPKAMGTGRKRQYLRSSSSTFESSPYSSVSAERCSTIVVPRSRCSVVSSISYSGDPSQLQCTVLAPSL